MRVCEHVDACAWSRLFCITVNLGIAGATLSGYNYIRICCPIVFKLTCFSIIGDTHNGEDLKVDDTTDDGRSIATNKNVDTITDNTKDKDGS